MSPTFLPDPAPRMRRAAELSPCGQYRYTLCREWDAESPKVTFVMLNPSTADHQRDDPTIRRCTGFARRWGFGGLYVGNLFAWRSSRPENLYIVEEPVGEDNDAALQRLVAASALTVAAWGTRGHFLQRDVAVMPLLRNCKALGFTKEGFPRHPLRLPYATTLVEFPPPPTVR